MVKAVEKIQRRQYNERSNSLTRLPFFSRVFSNVINQYLAVCDANCSL